MTLVSQERLTRHELSWLLAQEARGAAKALRDEVVKVQRAPFSDPPPAPVETTLDALDGAIEMLSALNKGAKSAATGRRGRIDLAALVYEVAPTARIAIEPGAGTEVFGDEADLRRMLHLLVTQASAGASQSEVRIRRQGDSVKISVDLGPDVAATGELERRWLSRMATRHGGHFELDGGTQTILLQADGASDQREVFELRQELKQAQELGEAYARELATALAGGEIRTEPPPHDSRGGSVRFEAIRGAASAFERIVRGNLESLRADSSAAAALAPNSELAQSLARRLAMMSELSAELTAIAECPLDEAPSEVDLCTTCRGAIELLAARASKQEVAIDARLPASSLVKAPRAQLGLIVRLLLSHAISATPRGGQIRISTFGTELGVVLTVQDGGPPVPEAQRLPLLRHATDPTRLGRPAGISLLASYAAAAALGSELELRDGSEGANEAWLALRGAG